VSKPDPTGTKAAMPVSHARDTAVTSTDEQAAREVPGLLERLAQVPDPRKRRGRRFLLVFVLAVAVACALVALACASGDQGLWR
jgi:fatty acid desaturase